MPIKNYTTEVSEERTVGEIMSLLAQKGARSIQIDYDDRNRPQGISFIIFVLEAPIPFKLPCDFDGVFRYMAKEYKDRAARLRFEQKPESMEQARRVAWRIIKDWVAAQMALIDAGQAALAQVFLPYVKMQEQGGISMYDKFLQQVASQKALNPAPDLVYKAGDDEETRQ
jgi:hypothetical protein